MKAVAMQRDKDKQNCLLPMNTAILILRTRAACNQLKRSVLQLGLTLEKPRMMARLMARMKSSTLRRLSKLQPDLLHRRRKQQKTKKTSHSSMKAIKRRRMVT